MRTPDREIVDEKVRVKMKGFLEVFPGLHMTEHMTELLGLVEVEKVSMNRDRSSLRVFIVSPRLIHKKNIMDLERGIRDQLFAGKKLQIKIAEKYKLSGQYTPEKLLQAYRDSLLLELSITALWNIPCSERLNSRSLSRI